MSPTTVFVSLHSTFGKIARLLKASSEAFFPLVDDTNSMVLMGSVHRHILEELLNDHLAELTIMPARSDGEREEVVPHDTVFHLCPVLNHYSLPCSR